MLDFVKKFLLSEIKTVVKFKKLKPLNTIPLGHFYSPIVSRIDLDLFEDQIWGDADESLDGINLNVTQQLELFENFLQYYDEHPFEGGGKKYPCGEYVDEATSLFLNRFADTYQRIAGGALAWDTIILTGGGSALLHQKLLTILKHENVILADQLDSLHLANVRGGLKLWRLYDTLKLL